MARDTRIKRTVNRAIDRRLAKVLPAPERPRWRIAKVFLFLVGVPGIVVGILSLLPRASVSPNDPLDPSTPFSSPFVVSNDGYAELYDVTFYCTPVRIETTGHQIIASNDKPGAESGVQDTSVKVGTLGRDGQTSVYCPIPFFFRGLDPIAAAHIRITLSFRPEWLFWRRTISSDFVLARDHSGQPRWLHTSQ
jgi:hypothetical protein